MLGRRRGGGRGRGKRTIALVDAAYEILEVERPTTVRAVCYRLFVAGFIDSMSKANTAKVSRALVSAREDGSFPWEWIVDETREAKRVTSWDLPDDVCVRHRARPGPCRTEPS